MNPVETAYYMVEKSIFNNAAANLLVHIWFLYFQTDFGLYVKYLRSWPSQAYVWINGAYSDEMEGLCGDCDADPYNDSFPQGWTPPGTFEQIGDSWNVQPE